MKTNSRQDKDFLDRLFKTLSSNDIIQAVRNLLEGDMSWVLDWVRETFDPDEVFTDEELNTWAEDNGYTKEK